MKIDMLSEELVELPNGNKVHAWIQSEDGIFDFDRVAHIQGKGIPLDQLRSDECVIAPGLIYRQRPEKGQADDVPQ